MNLSTMFILFLIYSFMGWVMEVIATYISTHKIVNRGFLIGPYCPIYGTAAIIILILLQRYQNDLIALFIMSVFLCSLIEYFTGLFLEKMFNTRWWDYSDRKFNIDGRVCLENLATFGLLGVVMVTLINPFFIKLISLVPSLIINIIAVILAIFVVFDYVISTTIIFKFKNISKGSDADSTEKVTLFVRDEIKKRNKKLYTRIVKAYPQFKVSKLKLKKKN